MIAGGVESAAGPSLHNDGKSKMFTLIDPPAAEPLTVPEIRRALRITQDDDDSLLMGMLATARTFVERRCDLALMQQSWRFEAPWDGRTSIRLRPRNVQSVDMISVSTDGTQFTAADLDTLQRTAGSPDLLSVDAALVPDAATICAVRVDFTAGFADAPSIPADLLRAVYILTAHYYEERELFRAGRYVSVPLTVDALIASFREVRL